MARDWNTLGITLVTEAVSKRHGPNNSDKATYRTDALIPVVEDVSKFVAAFGEKAVANILDGTSVRVMAQDAYRRAPKDMKAEDVLERIYTRLSGLRNVALRTGGKTVVKYALPDGTFYDGEDVTEYQAAYMAALIDSGVDSTIARTIALTQKLN